MTGAKPAEQDDDAGQPNRPIGPDGRPIGLADCYSALSASHPATQRAWQALAERDLAARAGVIEALQAAAEQYPNEQQFSFLIAMLSLWRAAEREGLEDALAALGAAETASRELERSYALCPSDHRIPGWLGPTRIKLGDMLGDARQTAEGHAILEQAVERYPTWGTFVKILAYIELPAHDPKFKAAVEIAQNFRALCPDPRPGETADRICLNTATVPRNAEGTWLYFGDLYAKAQLRDDALAAYNMAKQTPGYGTWVYRELLESRITTLDARIAAAASADTADDFQAVWDSNIVCSSCHQDTGVSAAAAPRAF
jgi:tetratricopeptide (TPR) repeat protein